MDVSIPHDGMNMNALHMLTDDAIEVGKARKER